MFIFFFCFLLLLEFDSIKLLLRSSVKTFRHNEGLHKKVIDEDQTRYFNRYIGRPGLQVTAGHCALECAVMGLIPLTPLLIMTHATTML